MHNLLMNYLKVSVQKQASDLYLITNSPPKIKIEGKMFSLGTSLLTEGIISSILMDVLNEDNQKIYKNKMQIDLALEIPGLSRFRLNAFHQKGHPAMVIRCINEEVPTLDELNMPDILKELSMLKRGLVLMVGATGSGKTTTLAAMLNYRNENSAGHILTIEDPIEFVHPHKESIISQREIGVDALSYDEALVASLREAPDVILIGEVRRKETMEACIQLANTGHLVISTLHANNSNQAIQRVLNLYPVESREQLYLDLSLTLKAILSQRLVESVNGKRIAALEIMLNTPYIQDLIASKKIAEIKELMSSNTSQGLISFDESLIKLYKSGRITLDEALKNADSSANLETKINFG